MAATPGVIRDAVERTEGGDDAVDQGTALPGAVGHPVRMPAGTASEPLSVEATAVNETAVRKSSDAPATEASTGDARPEEIPAKK